MGTPAQEIRHEFEHIELLLRKLRLPFLLRHLPPKVVWSAYVFVSGFVTIGLLALLGEITGSPFVFPSLGPSAYLLFFSPLHKSSSPRNAILGHAIGLLCGYGAFWITGMHPWQLQEHGLYWPRVLAAALALASTGMLMVAFSASHPPAGATTLIVALGILSKPWYLVVIEIAVVLLVLLAWLLNHLAGLDYPLWFREGERPLPPSMRP